MTQHVTLYLDCIFAASTGSSLDQGVARVDDSTDSVRVGMQLRLKGLMFLMLALTQMQEEPEHENQNIPIFGVNVCSSAFIQIRPLTQQYSKHFHTYIQRKSQN